MGFFQDLKEDLSQAVTELMDEETTDETTDETTTKTLPEEETSDTILQEDFLEAVEAETYSNSEETNLDSMLEEITLTTEEPKKYEKSIKPIKPETRYTPEPRIAAEIKNMTEEAVDETAIITKGMYIKGDVESKGSMDVVGSIEGNITVLGKLNVTGSIKGDSRAAEVFADAAKIIGEITSEGTVKIGANSVIVGNIIATCAVIAGAVKGDIDVRGPVVLDTSAIVMGNIKSKSVQINNGAVIEGLCSQCYAEVNPINFFDDFK